jgi:hypothetical protein
MLGLAVTDGNFIVGDGSTWVVESGATARDSLGIVASVAPDAAGDFVVGETASNSISVPIAFGGSPIVNGRVTLSVAASALTVTVNGMNDAALSTSNALFACMPQGNPLDGTYVVRKATANLTLVVSLGSTLGHANGATTPIYVYLLDNAGTLELGVSGSYFGDKSVQSTTTEGGAGGADSATVVYSTTGRTSVPIVPILRWDGAQTSAGVWLSIVGVKTLISQGTGISHGAQQFLTSDTWTAPAGVTEAWVWASGGGGGGGSTASLGACDAYSMGGGGGAGNAVTGVKVTPVPGTAYTVTIGAGGGAASTGGTTSLGALTSVTGGNGGGSGGVNTGANGGAANGRGGCGALAPTGIASGTGGCGPFGGGARGFSIAITPDSNGEAAAANSGAGGGGAIRDTVSGSQTGGAGGSGYLRVEW